MSYETDKKSVCYATEYPSDRNRTEVRIYAFFRHTLPLVMPRVEVAHRASLLAPRLCILGPMVFGVGLRRIQEGEQKIFNG